MMEGESNSVCNERLNNQSATCMLCPSVVKNLTGSFRIMKEMILKTSLFRQRSSEILAGSLSKIFENSQGSWCLWRSCGEPVWRCQRFLTKGSIKLTSILVFIKQYLQEM